MTKAELIERVAAKKDLPRDLTKKALARIIDSVFTEIGDYFIKAKVSRNATARFAYPGFGTFTKRKRNARVVKNPRNGDPIEVPAQSTVVFSVSQDLRGLLNRDARPAPTTRAKSAPASKGTAPAAKITVPVAKPAVTAVVASPSDVRSVSV